MALPLLGKAFEGGQAHLLVYLALKGGHGKAVLAHRDTLVCILRRLRYRLLVGVVVRAVSLTYLLFAVC